MAEEASNQPAVLARHLKRHPHQKLKEASYAGDMKETHAYQKDFIFQSDFLKETHEIKIHSFYLNQYLVVASIVYS